LNAFKVQRLTSAASHLRGRTANLLAINLDNEPVYWASGNAALGSDLLMADFNPATIEAAAHDGVLLDPGDGLSRGERLWLWKNLLHYNDMIGRAVRDALGCVRGGGSDPLR